MSLQKSLAIWVTAMAFSACITAVGVFGVRPASAQTYPQTFTLTPTSGTDIIFDDITLTQYSASSDAIYHHVHLEAGETLEYQLVVDTSELTYTASEGVNAITNTGITGFEVITTTDETAQSLPLYGAYQELITEDPPNWDLAQTYNFLHWYLAPGNQVAARFHKFECQGNRTPLSVWYKGYCSTSGPTYIDDGEAVHYDGNGGFYN